MIGRGSSRVVVAVVAVALVGVLFGVPRAEAVAGNVYFRGTVTCPEGQKFAGAWVNSSTGKSGFANKQVLPGTDSRQAKISRTLASVRVPTTVSINIGCGLKSGSQWRYVYNKVGSVKATRTGTIFINVGCSTTKCTAGAKGRGSGNTTWNPGADSSQCTWRASEFWKQMTGSYPGWGGNAGLWDDAKRALAWGWSTRAWPEPDSLMVTQPSSKNSAGHVGYVADVRVSNGKTQVKIYDRNFNWRGTDRNGVWLGVPSGARFIRVPPRFTPHNR